MLHEARELVTFMEASLSGSIDSETDQSDADADKLKLPKPIKSPRSSSSKRVSVGCQVGATSVIIEPSFPSIYPSYPGSHRHNEPVYKWKLEKFSGEHPEQALDFVADVEEKARTRLMGHEQLFIESAELFAGEALDWHRDAVRRVSNWSQLRQEFLIAYHGYGNDSGLRERIRSCKQTDSQSIDVFLGIMEGMYSRLERPIGEAERLEEILRNLNPFLKEKLVMTPMSSISDLRMYARTAESGRLRMGSSTCVSSSIPSPSPVRSLRREIAAASLAALPVGEAIEAVQSPTREPFSCYNCGSVDHPHRSCPLPRKKFCYRCGLPDVTTFTCTRCNRGQSKND
ncbi:hypothetical protein GE061_000742 [Apolygus lucorum]|uniref:CCHC-type domain-containing protein n=1 Tax=Apolygus lucorum TaxID=248454 RepID=A0A8S9Y178_APOLU|nr:hypothetical protein GE061_009678 [Apolygus lucorum]KAF6216400.1 hypothetical protein GE061_000742 [Apolygus lucorum]